MASKVMEYLSSCDVKYVLGGSAALGLLGYVIFAFSKKKNKTVKPGVVLLHSFPPTTTIVNPSPFALKLQTFLRITGIPYEDDFDQPLGPKQKAPWIEIDDKIISDSSLIIDYLKDHFKITLDEHLSDEELGLGRMVQKTFEENTVFITVARGRIFEDSEWFFTTVDFMSWPIKKIFLWSFKRRLGGNLKCHGMDMHSDEEIRHIAEGDLKAISVILGNKLYLFGDKPSSYDCALFGYLANIVHGLNPQCWQNIMLREKFPNLIEFVKHFKSEFWSDWDQRLK